MTTLRKLAALARRTPFHPQWLLGTRKVPSSLHKIRGRVLDVGAADRWIESQLPKAVQYVALDYPPTGRELYAGQPDVYGDGAELPFMDDAFDGVLCLEVLEHVPCPGAVLKEIARVLKSGGCAWISMPFLYPLHDAPFDFQRYTEYGLRRDLKAAGMEVVQLNRRIHAVRTAGLLASLAIAGGAYAQKGWVRWVLLPIALAPILIINIIAWLTSWVWPDWRHLAEGHEVEVRKP